MEATTVDEVYEAALDSLLDATDADRAAILLFDDDGVMRFQASRGLSQEYREAVTGHSPWTRGQMESQPIVISDVTHDKTLAAYRQVLAAEGIRALAFLPVINNRGVVGKFMLYYGAPHQCEGEELEIAQAIAAHVALATAHRQAQLAQARSEYRQQAIMENSAAAISLKDPAGRYLSVNQQWEQAFHTCRADAVGRCDRDLFPPETAEQFQANDRAVFAAGKPLAVEESTRQTDGIHTYAVMKFPLYEPDGAVSAVCGIATDITERKHLGAASQHLAAIIESSDDAIISKDLTGQITSWNRGAERIFGYRAEEVLGKPVTILAAAERTNEMPAILSRIRQGERVEHYETRRRRKDGQIIDVSLTVSPVRDEAGRIVGASKIARDITAQKAAERERLALLARERESRRTAELLNQVGPRLLALMDLDKLAQEITDIATSLIGADFGAFFDSTTQQNGERYAKRALSGACPEGFAAFVPPEFQGAGVLRSEDFTAFPGFRSLLAAPVVSHSKEVLGGLFFGHAAQGAFSLNHEAIVAGIAAQAGIAMDNARLFQHSQWVQSELKRSNDDLRRANRDLEVFAYSASHDLQEPLRTIAISAQLVERSVGDLLPAEERGFLGEIVSAGRRMSTLISDLSTYTRATKYEEGAAPRIESAEVLAGVIASLRSAIEESGAAIVAGDLPAVAMHEYRLTLLFQNLIGNALKYRSKEVPRVEVTAGQREGSIVFSIADNGIGMEPQYGEQIFGLFKRLHPRSEFPGSGIGLAICQRVVEQYGGRIWLERSAPGRGSTFCFSVPTGS